MHRTRLGVSWDSDGRAHLSVRGDPVLRHPPMAYLILVGKAHPKDPRDPREGASSADTCQGGPSSPAWGKLILQYQLPLSLSCIPGGRGF